MAEETGRRSAAPSPPAVPAAKTAAAKTAAAKTPAAKTPANPPPATDAAVTDRPPTPPPLSTSWLPAGPRTAKHAAPRSVPVPVAGATPPAPAVRVASGPGTAVIPAVTGTAVATPTLDAPPTELPAPSSTLHRVSRRKPGRGIGSVSALLGTVGLLLGLVIAAVNVSKWPSSAVCQAYTTAHKGGTEFGCGSGSRSLAEIVPPVGCAILVLAALAGIWIPAHSNRRRGLLLLVWAALLIAVAGVEAAVYAAPARLTRTASD